MLIILAGGLLVFALLAGSITRHPSHAQRVIIGARRARWFVQRALALLLPIRHRRAPVTEPPPPLPSIVIDPGRPAVSIDGLRAVDVTERRSRGEVNVDTEQTSRTVTDILAANIFTRFNALLGGLFVLILLIGGMQDALFGLVVIVNTAIGVGQELRAKRTLDRLRVMVALRAHVVRDGVTRDLPVDQIVLDDVLELRPGDQVPVDGMLLAAENLEINEALLTGEADPVVKSGGEQVLSGSLVVSGRGHLRAVAVGEAAYSRRLARAAQKFGLARSQLREGINDILRYVTWALVPTASALFVTQILYSPSGIHDAAIASTAGVVGMVPEGLVLLTSTVMAIAVVRLARQGALVQELAAVELLARVDIICADKTGTLTEGGLTLEAIIPLGKDPPPAHVRSVLGAFAHAADGQTASTAALRNECPPPNREWKVSSSLPFSSQRRWSGLSFVSRGSWVLGAPEVVLGNVDRASELLAEVDELARNGKRVLALARSKDAFGTATHAILPSSLEPEALIVLGERIRAGVATTIGCFARQGITVKVLSGDHAETVQSVAELSGLRPRQRAMDASGLPADPSELGRLVDRNDLFGRVTPAQKRLMVRALRDRGHVVAMIGDGINDVLAIKEADFGIALGSGTPASRAVAQLILLDDSFAALPAVIAEGNRVIANVERTANLFVTKTVYVFALALAIGLSHAPFPFLPRHLTLVGFLTIGAPGLFLALARNTTVARAGFVARVLGFALPAGAFAAGMTLLGYSATRLLFPHDTGLARTAATLTLVACGFLILVRLAPPRDVWQWLFLLAVPAMLIAVIALPWLRAFFALQLAPVPA